MIFPNEIRVVGYPASHGNLRWKLVIDLALVFYIRTIRRPASRTPKPNSKVNRPIKGEIRISNRSKLCSSSSGLCLSILTLGPIT